MCRDSTRRWLGRCTFGQRRRHLPVLTLAGSASAGALRASVRRHRRAQGCRSCSRCGRHHARRHCGNASGSARNVSSTVATVRAPLFRQTKVSARSPYRSMTASNSLQRPVRASVPSSGSVAYRRTVPGQALARDSATIRWAPDGGFGDRVGCILPVRPLSQGYPGRLTAKEIAGAAMAIAVAASVKRHVLFSE